VITTADAAGSVDPSLTLRKAELYADAVRRHGAKAVFVTSASPAAERDRLFGEMDGLLLTGGADLDPALYREPPAGAPDPEAARDETGARRVDRSRATVRAGLRHLPRSAGHHVFSGGSLIQDVPDHAGTPYGQGPAHTHNLEVDPDSRLARALARVLPRAWPQPMKTTPPSS